MRSSPESARTLRLRRAARALAFGLGAFGLVSRAAGAAEIVAHRGGYAAAPENTLAAFRACAGLADRVELDVQLSADGHYVVFHDDLVDRTTDGSGAVRELSLAQLKTLDAGARFAPAFAGERIPTLAEALRALPPGLPALLEFKNGDPGAVAEILRAADAIPSAAVLCGGWDFLFALHRLDPRIPLCAGGAGPLSAEGLAMFQRNGVSAVVWNAPDVTPATVALVHEHGLRIYVPVAARDALTFLDMGVDGLLVDDLRAVPASARAAKPAGIPAAADARPLPVRADPPAASANGSAAAALLSRDLVAYWKLDDGQADPASVNAEEASGRGRGRLSGFAPGWCADAVAGGALRLDGRDDYVRIPPADSLEVGANAVSISCWAKLDALPSALPGDFAFLYGSDLASYELFLDRARRELRFRATDAALQTAGPGIPEADLRTGAWLHVVGVYDGAANPAAGQTRIYLDGLLRDSRTGADASPGHGLTGPVRPGPFAAIGRPGDRDESYFPGAVDEIAVWRRPLSADEIAWLYATGSAGLSLDARPAER